MRPLEWQGGRNRHFLHDLQVLARVINSFYETSQSLLDNEKHCIAVTLHNALTELLPILLQSLPGQSSKNFTGTEMCITFWEAYFFSRVIHISLPIITLELCPVKE